MHMERSDRVNISTLAHILTSARQYLYRLANPPADTDALLLGRVVHCMAYEPEAVSARYAVSPRFHARQNDATAIGNGYDGGKQAKAIFQSTLGSRECVAPELYQRADGMVAALRASETCAPFLVGGLSEHKIEWTDPVTGILCRGRLDKIQAGVSDLKSCRALSAFERDAARMMYHAKLAWYHDAAGLAGIDLSARPAFVAVESLPPYDCAVFDVPDEVLAVGRAMYRRALDRLFECRMTGIWPGYVAEGRRDMHLPAWANLVEDSLPEPTGEQDII